ncbi:MAG TPA: hypothetical protein VF135_12850 [Terriglobales bacterium]
MNKQMAYVQDLSKRARLALELLMQAMREIFDENAYARFLEYHGLRNTREAYASYLRESKTTRERRPRCC